MRTSLSKSLYTRGIQCHKSLWLYKYKPDLRTLPDESKQAVFDTGSEVGRYAQGLFPGGEEITYEGSTFEQKIQQTQEYIKNGARTIYEATFTHDDITVMVDILHLGSDGWELYEVKSSTSLKEQYLDDISVQYYVLAGCGLTLSKACLVHLNNKYVRHGDIDISQLFHIEELTEQVRENQMLIPDTLSEMRSALRGSCPDIDIGPQCSTPYECDFSDHCWEHIPDYSIFNIARLNSNKKFSMYQNGIVHFNDIPDDYPLSDNQRLQVEAELNGDITVNEEEICKFLDTMHYPRYYLDFETFQPAIPLFEGTKPYQQVVFQFSLHVQESKDSDLKHYEHLMQEGTDGREELVAKLTGLIPDDACVITYNATFEESRLKEMAEQFPKYKSKLNKIINNIVDIMKPFQNKHYYTKELQGSYSIKMVLPALCPELGYEDMGIGDGGEAMRAYKALPFIEDKQKVEQIKNDLLEYCKLDTLGMVKIVEQLKEICDKS